MTRRTNHLSATSIATFKACPERFNLAYVIGIRQEADTESQRMGTNWHKLHQVYRNFRAEGMDHDAAFDATIGHLNEAYATVPLSIEPGDWITERTILAACFAGYLWYYGNDVFETVATEIPFELPLTHPKTGMPLPLSDVKRVGKIDRVVRWDSRICNQEYKSTSKPIDPESSYWAHLKLDTQVGMYAVAMRDLHRAGLLEEYGIEADAEFGGTVYDVFHKPQIRPKALSQADTKAVIESGQYCNTEFSVVVIDEKIETTVDPETGKEKKQTIRRVTVDGEEVEVENGARGFAIRETPEMFGARLLADIYDRPHFYFARREVARSDADLRRFRTEMYNVYQSQKQMQQTGHFFKNETQCEATFKCPYIPLCYANVDVSDGSTPQGFKRIFQDVTVGETD